jgi:hypothetical protein
MKKLELGMEELKKQAEKRESELKQQAKQIQI